jgi:hypothetical protein
VSVPIIIVILINLILEIVQRQLGRETACRLGRWCGRGDGDESPSVAVHMCHGTFENVSALVYLLSSH